MAQEPLNDEERKAFKEKLSSLHFNGFAPDHKTVVHKHDKGTVEVTTRDDSQDIQVRPDTIRRKLTLNQ